MNADNESQKPRRFGPRLVVPAGRPSALKDVRIKLGMTQTEASAWANQHVSCKHITWVSWENAIQGREAPPIVMRLMQIMLARKDGGPWTPPQLAMIDDLIKVAKNV